jgi:predicted negative regulator of RcsB-dependent stress response
MKKYLQKGIITLQLPVVLTVLGLTGTCAWTVVQALDTASDDRNSLRIETAVNKQRITTLEDQYKNIDIKLDKLLKVNN